MPLQVYECDKCHHLIKHVLDKRFSDKYSYNCPKCREVSNFSFIRESDPTKDWFGHMIRIQNRKRRKSDSVYKSTGSRKSQTH